METGDNTKNDLPALHKKTAEALQQSEAFSRGILASLSSSVTVIDEAGTIITVNKAWEDFALENGITRLEQVAGGVNYFDVCNKAAAAGDDIAAQAVKGIKSVLKKEIKVFELQYPCHAPDKQRWFLLRVMLFENGEPMAVVAHNNITEIVLSKQKLEKSERHLRAIYNTEPECIKILGPKGELLDINPAGLAMIEADSLETVKGKSVLGIIAPKDRDAFVRLTKNVFNGESGILEFEITGFKGTHRLLETHAVPLRDDSGKIISLLSVTRDITASRKAEEAILKSEKRYQTLAEISPVGIFHTDADGNTTYVNPRWCQISGLSFENALGNGWVNAVHEDDKNILTTSWQQATKNQELSLSEYRFVRPDGTIAWVMGQAFPERNLENKIVGYVGTTTDITERKLAEDKLRKSERKLREITASLPGIVYQFSMDADGKVIFIFLSEGVKEYLDVSVEDIYKDSSLLFSAVHPDDIERLISAIALSNKDLAPLTIVYRILIKDGTYVWVRSDSIPVLLKEGTVLRNGSIIDITATKEAEEELNTAHKQLLFHVENAPLGYIEWDNQLFVKSWSKKAEEIFGWSETEFIEKQKNGFSLVYEEDVPGMSIVAGQLMSGAIERNSITHRNYTKDGSVIWCEWFNSVLKDKDGIVITIMSLVQDITEQKLAEERLSDSELKFRNLVENIHESLIIEDKEGHLLYANSEFSKIFGFSEDEFKNLSLKDYTSPEFYDEVLERHNNRMKGARVPEEFEYKGLRKDGSEIWIECRVTTLMLNGEITGTQSLVKDITARKQAEFKLNKAHQQINYHINNTPLVVIEWDKNDNVIKWNKRAEELFGWTADEAIGKPMKNALVYKDDIGLVNKSIEVLVSGIAQSGPFENRNNSRDGRIIYCQWYNTILTDEQGNIETKLSIINDITERKLAEEKIKESEEKYRSLMQQAGDLIILFDSSGHIIEANETAKQILGYSNQEYIGMPLKDFFFEEDLKKTPLQLDLLNKGRSTINRRRVKRKDGVAIETEIHTKKLSDGRYLGVGRDLTERIEAEQKLRESETKYRTMVERNLAGIYQTTIQGKILSCNDAFVKMLGYNSQKDLLQKNAAILYFSDTDRDDFLTCLGKKGELNDRETMLKKKDGSPVYMIENCSLRKDLITGEDIIEGVVMDITERKKIENTLHESEETFRRLFDESADSILLLDDTGFTRCNQSAATILGYSSPQEVLVKQPWEISPEKQPDGRLSTEKAAAMISETLQQGYNRFEWVHTKLDGTEFPVEVMLTPIILKGKQSFYTIWRDIAERKKAEQALTDSEHRYRSLVEQASDGILMADFQGNIIEVNSALCSLFGYTKKEALQKNMTLFLDPEDLALKPIRLEQLSKGHSLLVERKGIHKNGCLFDIEISSKLIGEGKLLSIIRDVSERKKAQEQIHMSEEKYRSFFEQSADAIFIFDKSGRFLDMNTISTRLLGYTKKELRKMSLFDVVFKEDLAANPIVLELLATGEAVIRQRTLKKKDGTPVEVEVHSKKLPDGKYMGVVRDITESRKAEEALKESEAKYRTIINTTDEMIQRLSPEGRIIWVNESWKINMGLTDKEVIGKKLTDFIDEATKIELGKMFPLLMKGKRVKNLSCGFITKKRDVIFLEGQVLPVINKGEVTGSQAFLRNVTERRKTEKELEESYRSVRQLTEYLQNIREEERTHIAREIHDELGQQLTVMMMDVAWLDKKIGPENNLAKEKIKELMEMLNSTVKSVRRISSELRPSILDDLGLSAAMEFHLKEFEKRSGIRTRLTIPKTELELTGPVKNALFRIFQESLTNVARHSGAKAVTVKLEKENKKIVLKIADDGVGFDEQEATAKKTLGILGMKERATAIGGKYLIKGEAGKGTNIIVTVPVPE